MKGVILAAGKGKRMLGLSDLIPKPLLPLANVPALLWSIQGMRETGVDRVLLIVGHGADIIKTAIGDGRQFGVRVDYVLQKEARGTGHAMLLARDFAGGDAFVAMYGDVVCSRDNFSRMVALYRSERPGGIMAAYAVADPWTGGVMEIDQRRIVAIVEKPPRESVRSNLINAGLFVFQADIFGVLAGLKPTERNEIELTCAVRELISLGRRIIPYPIPGFWVNLTDPVTYLEANRCVLNERADRKETLISPSAQIDPHAELAGSISAGDKARIARCRIGPDVSIGSGCCIGAEARLKSCILLDDVRIGQAAIIENAVLGPGVLVKGGSQIVGGTEPALVLPRKLIAES